MRNEMGERSKSRLLFVHNHRARFVMLDQDMLRERRQVTEMYLRSRIFNPFRVLVQVWRHDAVVGWFASWHTFLPMLFARILGKGSVLIVGGYDIASLEEIGYGHQRGGLKKCLSRWTMNLARCLVTHAAYNHLEAMGSTGLDPQRLNVVFLALPDTIGTLPTTPRGRIALSVGNVDRTNLHRKGHEPFVRAAADLPDVEFVLVGDHKDDAIEELRSIATSNVRFTGRVSDSELLDCYRRASVYVQASRHEGFGLSVAEAMLAGCIPVVSKCGALPEVVADCGIYIDSINPQAIAEAVSKALELPGEARAKARQRILQEFPMVRRQERFEALLDGPEPWR
jgi:glycosyltransferase involved in cell wall biosynthesis